MPKTIILKGNGIQKEGKAGGTITPGQLVARTSTGTIVVHAGAALNALKAFAKENEVIGKDIDTNYTVNENVIFEVCHSGMEVLARLPASAAAIVIGDFLESNGAGYLRKVATDATVSDTEKAGIVAIALEAIDNSSGPAGVPIKVEVI
jgi:hypothetical protein